MAAWNGHEAVVEALIEAGAEVNKADNNGKTPLYYVARDGMSLIEAMVANGHEAVVKALIEAGAEAALDGSGMTS
jgi:cytohesin